MLVLAWLVTHGPNTRITTTYQIACLACFGSSHKYEHTIIQTLQNMKEHHAATSAALAPSFS